MTANEQNITPGFYWANLAAYRLEETLSTGLPIRFSQRMTDNKKLALACARRNLLAFFSGNVVDAEIQAALNPTDPLAQAIANSDDPDYALAFIQESDDEDDDTVEFTLKSAGFHCAGGDSELKYWRNGPLYAETDKENGELWYWFGSGKQELKRGVGAETLCTAMATVLCSRPQTDAGVQAKDDTTTVDPDPTAPSYLQARQDMANELRSFKLAHLGVISTETDDALVNSLLRMRSKLAAVRVGAQVIVNVPSRVGLLGIATVVREAGINCECIGLPGFRTTVGIKWTFGPFIAGDDILGVKSQEIRAITQSIGLNIDSPIQAVTFSQFSHIAKLFV
jgi:hypothetical protein